MKNFVLLTIFIIIILSKESFQYNEKHYDSSLQDRYNQVKMNLINSFQEKFHNNHYDSQISVKFHDMQKISLNSVPVYFDLLNTTCILIYNKIFSLSMESDTFVLKLHSVVPNIESQAVLLKAIEYENTLLIFVAFDNGYSNVYLFSNYNWILLQKIHNSGTPADALLFYHRDQLYLFVANEVEHTYVNSVLYSWTGRDFEEMDQILTRGATSIAFFENINSFVLIITQNPKENPKAGSIVLVFNQGKLRQLQLLNTDAPMNILTYTIHDKRYVIVFSRNTNITIYRWNGNYLTPWLRVENVLKYEQISMYYIENRPVLFAAKKDSVILYDLNRNVKMITAQYYEQYKEIFYMDFVYKNNQTYLYMLAQNEDERPEMIFISFSVDIDATDNSNNFLSNCLANLNKLLTDRTQKLNHIKNKIKKVIRSDQIINYPGELNIQNNVVLKNSTFKNKFSPKAYRNKVMPTHERLKNLERQINENTIFDNLIIVGNLYVEQMKTERIKTNKILNNPSLPNKWFSNVNNQVFIGPVTINHLKCKNLTVNNPNSIFSDLLLLTGNQKLYGSKLVDYLKINNLSVTNINDIAFSNMKLRNDSKLIGGKKYFKHMKVHKISSVNKIGNINFKYLSQKLPTNKWIQSGYFFKNIDFELINQINWKDFTNSLIKKNSDITLNGTIHFYSPLNITNLKTTTLSGVETKSMFTTSTNQEISSDMQLMHINVENINAVRVNGISFKTDVITISENNIIDGHISIKDVHILNNLTNSDSSFNLLPNSQMKTLQIYDGVVKIKGDVHVSSLFLKTPLQFQNQSAQDYIYSKFWSKSLKQVIPVDLTFFDNVITQGLNTGSINKIKCNQFQMVNFENNEHLKMTFKHIYINGSFNSRIMKNCKMNIEKLLKESVRKHGSFIVRGHKDYENDLFIDELKTEILDNTLLEDIVNVNGPNKFINEKKFANVIFENDINLLESKKIKGKFINDVFLNSLLQRTIFIYDTMDILHLNMARITSTNINFVNSNGYNVDNITKQFMDLFFLNKIKHVTINGDVTINNVDMVEKVNHIEFEDYLHKVAFINEDVHISDSVIFSKTCHIDNIGITSINNINLINFGENLLSKSKRQSISKPFFFDKVYCPFIVTSKLNNLHTNDFINTQSNKDIVINSNLSLLSLNVEDSVKAKYLNNEMSEITHALKIPISNENWKSIKVTKDVHVVNPNGNLGNIIYSVVKVTDPNIVITENINFNHVSAKTIELFDSKINNINIRNIADDALRSNGEVQIVLGRKTFSKITAARISVNENAKINTVNNINIANFNSTFIDRNNLNSELIRGKKVFTTLKIKNLEIPDKIHGILPRNLVSTSEKNVTLPNVHFSKIKIIDDFSVEHINTYNMIETLDNRMVCNNKGVQFVTEPFQFDKIILLDKSNFFTINNISLHDVVTDDGIQKLNKFKQFLAPVHIENDMHVEKINGYKLEEKYVNSLNKNKDAIFKNVIFKKPVTLLENLIISKINNVNTTFLKNIVKFTDFKLKNNKTFNTIAEIEKNFNKYLQETIDENELSNHLHAITVHIPLNYFGNLKTSKLLSIFLQQSSLNCGTNMGNNTDNIVLQSLHNTEPIDEYKNTDLYHCVTFNKSNANQNYIRHKKVKCVDSLSQDKLSGGVILSQCMLAYDKIGDYSIKNLQSYP